jgi:hypothetical protein
VNAAGSERAESIEERPVDVGEIRRGAGACPLRLVHELHGFGETLPQSLVARQVDALGHDLPQLAAVVRGATN